MFRNIIALVLALLITISGIVKPAYADSSNLNYLFINSAVVVTTQGDRNSLNINSSVNGYDSNSFFDTLIQTAMTTLAGAIGAAIVCYGIDGVATLFFPPIGALSAFCPAVGGAFGSGNAVTQGVKTVTNAI